MNKSTHVLTSPFFRTRPWRGPVSTSIKGESEKYKNESEVRKMLKSIYRELRMIRKVLQDIRNILESDKKPSYKLVREPYSRSYRLVSSRSGQEVSFEAK